MKSISIEYNEKMLDKLLNMTDEGFEYHRKIIHALKKEEAHIEDMQINPDRHFLKENKYSRFDFNPCLICNPDLKEKFTLIPSLDLFVKKI